ncbi:MFS general substrate transporter [Ceraceosorus guamensis]|uniref:MFS general substrate transporter n=1 Tax=Ceraceosorus guamensis TaxID=1522189 RepID=A0A316VUB8_9BASI|nr:MFS general substrate transporter [Ceraceosorus guamensis]PWN40033.1 MFS general substrate transporter [Ceraceosorus guamensis]
MSQKGESASSTGTGQAAPCKQHKPSPLDLIRLKTSALHAPSTGTSQGKTPFPDGGKEAWLSVLGSWFALAASFGMVSSFGIFQTYYQMEILTSSWPSQISWIGSLQTFLFFLLGMPVGRVFDAYGPKRLVFCGTLVLSFALMMTSLATQHWHFILAQGFVGGVGCALMFYPAPSSIASYFLRRRGLAMGIAVTGSSAGGIIFPIALNNMFSIDTLSFGWSVRIVAFIVLAFGLLAVRLMSSRALESNGEEKWTDISAFKEAKYSLLCCGSCLIALGIFGPYFYLESYAIQQDVAPNLAFYLIAILNAGSLLGRLLAAPLMDYIGNFNTLLPSTLLSGVFCVAWWIPISSMQPQTKLPSIVLFAVMYGVVSGAYMACLAPCIAAISPIEQIGARIGMIYSLISLPALLSNPISGAFLSSPSDNTYHHLMAWAGVTQIVGVIFVSATRLLISRSLHAKV